MCDILTLVFVLGGHSDDENHITDWLDTCTRNGISSAGGLFWSSEKVLIQQEVCLLIYDVSDTGAFL